MRKWGFIYTSGGAARLDRIGSSGCELVAVGIPAVSGAVDAARSLAAEGVELIELCGAFGPEAQAAVRAVIPGSVALGAMSYACEEASRLQRLFDEPEPGDDQAVQAGAINCSHDDG